MAVHFNSIIKTKLEPIWEAHPEILLAWLFGSTAQNTAGNLSDIDIAVLYAGAPTLLEHGRLASQLSGALARDDVDLVILNDAAPFLKFRILRDGALLLDRDPVQRVTFTAESLSRYFDLQPALDQYYRLTHAH